MTQRESQELFYRFFRTDFGTSETKDALGSVLPFAGRIQQIHIHRTGLDAFAAGNALFGVNLNAKKRKIGHRLQKNGNGTDILTESPVIFENQSE